MGLLDTLRRRPKRTAEEAVTVERREEEARPRLLAANFQGQGQREGQEDSFAILGASNPEERGLFALVVDGMGGMADGKAASEWAAECFLQLYASMEEGGIPAWFYRSVHAVSESVFQRFRGQSGTTLVAVHLFEDRLHWLSVGDSAIFLCRNGGVFQLNREHTCLNRLYLQELEQPVIDKVRAETDPDARRLTSFVGIDRLTEVDLSLRPLELQSGDSLLLCSDGVSGVLTPPELLEAMTIEPDQGCALLEKMILEKDLPQQDNYTGILISRT